MNWWHIRWHVSRTVDLIQVCSELMSNPSPKNRIREVQLPRLGSSDAILALLEGRFLAIVRILAIGSRRAVDINIVKSS